MVFQTLRDQFLTPEYLSDNGINTVQTFFLHILIRLSFFNNKFPSQNATFFVLISNLVLSLSCLPMTSSWVPQAIIFS